MKLNLTQFEQDYLWRNMNWIIRNDLYEEIAPCNIEEFLITYCERDPQFEYILEDRGIHVKELTI